MKDDIMAKAPGMKFVIDINEKVRVTPRVIHALGNIKWGFSDGLRPIAVEKVQSKWDREHEMYQLGQFGSTSKLDEYEPTSKAVSWPKVIRRYLALNGRETELKEPKDVEPNVISIMKSLRDIRNDGSIEATKLQAKRWTKIPAETKKKVIQKWEEKAAANPQKQQ